MPPVLIESEKEMPADLTGAEGSQRHADGMVTTLSGTLNTLFLP